MLDEALLYSKELTKVSEEPFLLYQNSDTYLIISGIGKTNAASALSYMLTKDQSIDKILNIGFVGGYPPLKQGEILKVSQAKYHDFDLQMFGYEAGQVPKMPIYYQTNKDLLNKINLKEASLFTGDKFLTEPLNIEENYIVDMEGTSYYQVAHLFNKPIISIKVVSDVIGSKNQVTEYKDFEENKDQYIYNVLKEIIKEV